MEAPVGSSCWSYFQVLMKCQSPYMQFQHYYQHGNLTSCEFEKKLLKNCIRSKTSSGQDLQNHLRERDEIMQTKNKLPDIWTHK